MKLSPHYATFPLLLPRVIGLLRNWPSCLLRYVGRISRPASYRLRDGRILHDNAGTLAGTFAVVFLRREYGVLDGLKSVVDVGANLGTFAVYVAGMCPDARVYCFEPASANFEQLRKNIVANGLKPRVSAFQRAVGGRVGRSRLALRKSPLHSVVVEVGDEIFEDVTVTTLREILVENGLDRIDLLKLNCEGMEYEILSMLSKEDAERIDRIRMEYHNLGSATQNGAEACALLEALGYRIERFSKYLDSSGFIWATRMKGTPEGIVRPVPR